MQIGEDAHRAGLDHVLAEARKVARSSASGVDAGCHAASPAEIFGVDSKRCAAPVDVRMQVDQPRSDDEAANIAHVSAGICRKVCADPGDATAGKGNVTDTVEILRRIDDSPTFEDQLKSHWPVSIMSA